MFPVNWPLAAVIGVAMVCITKLVSDWMYRRK